MLKVYIYIKDLHNCYEENAYKTLVLGRRAKLVLEISLDLQDAKRVMETTLTKVCFSDDVPCLSWKYLSTYRMPQMSGRLRLQHIGTWMLTHICVGIIYRSSGCVTISTQTTPITAYFLPRATLYLLPPCIFSLSLIVSS